MLSACLYKTPARGLIEAVIAISRIAIVSHTCRSAGWQEKGKACSNIILYIEKAAESFIMDSGRVLIWTLAARISHHVTSRPIQLWFEEAIVCAGSQRPTRCLA
jgi:hypothetical protein